MPPPIFDMSDSVSAPPSLLVPPPDAQPASNSSQGDGKVKPVHVDGLVVVGMGALTALMGALDSDQAKAILYPMPLFILQTACLTINGGLVALNGFRSEVFAKSKE